jgi:hypothetical protein
MLTQASNNFSMERILNVGAADKIISVSQSARPVRKRKPQSFIAAGAENFLAQRSHALTDMS